LLWPDDSIGVVPHRPPGGGFDQIGECTAIPSLGGSGVDVALKSHPGMTGNAIGMTTVEYQRVEAKGEQYMVYLTLNMDQMTRGLEMQIDTNSTLKDVREKLMSVVLAYPEAPKPASVHVYFPGGIPFLHGTISDFFNAFGQAGSKGKVTRCLYVVVTRVIPDSLTSKWVYEVCDCGNSDSELLLSPICDSSEIGLTHMACLLGCFDRSDGRCDELINSMTCFTGFAPLITGLRRILDKVDVRGRHVIAVTASLFTFYRYLLPSTLKDNQVFEYCLRASCWLVHGISIGYDSKIADIPMKSLKPGDPIARYCSGCKGREHGEKIIYCQADFGAVVKRERLDKPTDPQAIENAFAGMVAFRPVHPLMVRARSGGVAIINGVEGRTLLYIGPSNARGHLHENHVLVHDPITGRTQDVDVEELAKYSGEQLSTQLVEPGAINQLVFICFDMSGSMSENLAGQPCDLSRDFPRITIAAQYLTTFANRMYGYRVPCLQGLLAFNDEIKVLCPLSALVPDFEKAVCYCKEPKNQTHLWDALGTAADHLVKEYWTEATRSRRRYPNAMMRILVISSGDDVNSSAKPWDVCANLIRNQIILDAIILNTDYSCKTLAALCSMTGGSAFRPESVVNGLELCEEEAFLNLSERKLGRKCRRAITEAEIENEMRIVTFLTSAEKVIITAAVGTVALATPKWLIYKNRNEAIPESRRRRILRELHAAAAADDPDAEGEDENGHKIKLHDQNLKIVVTRTNIEQWRCYMRAPEGTLYSGKWWYMYVTFPDTYPVRPPKFRFISIPYHLNVSKEGRVCLNIIDRGYVSAMPVIELLQHIKELFVVVDEGTPIQMDKLFQYKEKRAEYERMARDSCRNAKDNLSDWYDLRNVEQSVPEDFTVAVPEGERVPPYLRSGRNNRVIPKVRQVRTAEGIIYDRDERRRLLWPDDSIGVVPGPRLFPSDDPDSWE
jgi:ubiquitin-conjugating enzyme E2 D/E